MSITNLKDMNYYTEEDYIRKCKKLGNTYVGTHKVYHKGTMVDYICNKHTEKGVQSCDWSHYKAYKQSCPYCSGRYKTNKDIVPLIKNKDVELISDYTGNEKPITCRCRSCANVWVTLSKVLTTNGSGCPKCGKEKAARKRTKSQNDFIKELRIVNPDIEIIGDYAHSHTKVKCLCKIDGTIWYGYPANLLNRSAGCPTCNISNSERQMIQILKKLNLNIRQQYMIDDCIYERKLKFDAFDIDSNIAFEYNGEQHYRPIDFAGKGNEWAQKQFELTKYRDNAKIKYCNQNKIPIVIVPYWKRDNMESFIISELDKVGIKIN